MADSPTVEDVKAAPATLPARIRVLVVDDHPLLRVGLRYIIKDQLDMELVGEAGDGAAAIETARACSPDVVVMDIDMPGDSGIETTRRILADRPGTRVIVLSAFPDANFVNESIKAGASGYVLKNNAWEDLLQGIRAVMRGQSWMCPEAVSLMIANYRDHLRQTNRPALSDRELEVLKLIAEGLRAKEIAARLSIGSKTVDTYRARLMAKLNCSSTAELVRYAIREGISTV